MWTGLMAAGFSTAASGSAINSGQSFWQAVGLYLGNKVHEVFRQWDAATKTYPSKIRRVSVDATERQLHLFVDRVVQQAVETDNRVRAANTNERASAFNISVANSRVLAEIERLGNAHRALLDEQAKEEEPQLSLKQKTENFIGENKGILSVISVLIAFIGLAIRFFGSSS